MILRRLLTLLVGFALVAVACSGDDDTLPEDPLREATVAPSTPAPDDADAGTDSNTAASPSTTDGPTRLTDHITVAIIDNGSTDHIEALTGEFFTDETGIAVAFEIIEPGEISNLTSMCDPGPCHEWDVVEVSEFEAATQFGFGLTDLSFAQDDPDYDYEDIFPAIRTSFSNGPKVSALPIWVESTFLMANQNLLDVNDLELPENPTWQQIDEIARELHSDDAAGICMDVAPSWGQLGATLTTVVNTFGGTWWQTTTDLDAGLPQINQPDSGFREATEFTVDLLTDAGPDDPATLDHARCLELFQNGEVALFFGGTSAATTLEQADSPIASGVRYVHAPVVETDNGGALRARGFGIPTGSRNQDAAWQFIRWATSPQFAQLLLGELGPDWSIAPTYRQSTFDLPDYHDSTEPFRSVTFDQIDSIDPLFPGTTLRHGGPGVQQVGDNAFPSVATPCSEAISAAMTGDTTVDEALDRCQELASTRDSGGDPLPDDAIIELVPNVVGMTLSEAETTLDASGFTPSRVFVNPNGAVIFQGFDLTDQPLASVMIRNRNQDTLVTAIEDEPTIQDQRPLGLQRFPTGSDVIIHVEIGVIDTVPSVFGRDLLDATDLLHRRGYNSETVFVDQDGEPVDISQAEVLGQNLPAAVISQDPPAGVVPDGQVVRTDPENFRSTVTILVQLEDAG